jgi:hypothetical protein
MREVVIFCQASADVQYALAIYEQYRDVGRFRFFVINVLGIYNFLTDLHLEKARIEYIPYPKLNPKSPKSIRNVRQYITWNIKQHFVKMKNCDVYYFSNKYDWLAFAFISHIAKRNRVFCYDHYAKSIPYIKKKSLPLKYFLKLIIYLYVTRVALHFEWINDRAVISFSYDKYGITERNLLLSGEINAKYAYRVDANDKGNRILFFESGNNANNIENYEATIKSIVEVFISNGITLYVKPHPRLGYSTFLDEYDVTILPSYIPGEFIDYHGFSAIVGISTVAIAKIAVFSDVPTFSLIDSFKFKNISEKENYRRYLNEQSNHRIRFVKDVQECFLD